MSSRTFLVTGATKGIGRALSERLLKSGHDVIGIARTVDDTFPGQLFTLDLSDTAEVERKVAALAESTRIDGLVNNAGFIKLQSLTEIDLADSEEILRLNLLPSIALAKVLVPRMKERGWGRIVNLSSLVSLGMQQRTAYAAAKAAVISMTRTWALELATSGITVNAVAPGPVETEMFRQNTAPGSDREKAFLGLIPMRRLGQPHEIAAAVEFFLSEDAGFISGQTLFADGGGSVGKASL